jgi:hypothetical protein
MVDQEATARIKINRLLEEAGSCVFTEDNRSVINGF